MKSPSAVMTILPSRFPRHAAAVGLMLVWCLSGCDGTGAAVEKAVGDPTLSDSEAVRAVAEAIFQLDDATITTEKDGSVTAVLVVRGADNSRVPAGPDGVSAVGQKKRTLAPLIKGCGRLIEAGRKRNLGKIVVTLKIAAYNGTGEKEWFEVFRFRVPGDMFDHFTEFASRSETEIAGAEQQEMFKIWDLEMDGFDRFSYRQRG